MNKFKTYKNIKDAIAENEYKENDYNERIQKCQDERNLLGIDRKGYLLLKLKMIFESIRKPIERLIKLNDFANDDLVKISWMVNKLFYDSIIEDRIETIDNRNGVFIIRKIMKKRYANYEYFIGIFKYGKVNAEIVPGRFILWPNQWQPYGHSRIRFIKDETRREIRIQNVAHEIDEEECIIIFKYIDVDMDKFDKFLRVYNKMFEIIDSVKLLCNQPSDKKAVSLKKVSGYYSATRIRVPILGGEWNIDKTKAFLNLDSERIEGILLDIHKPDRRSIIENWSNSYLDWTDDLKELTENDILQFKKSNFSQSDNESIINTIEKFKDDYQKEIDETLGIVKLIKSNP